MTNDKTKKDPKDEAVDKGIGPFGSKIVPEKFNQTAPADNIGGWEDARGRSAATMNTTARRGAGAGASQTNAGPAQKPPTPSPNGRDKGNRPNPWAKSSQQEHARAKGPNQGPRAEASGRRLASTARNGSVKIPLSPQRHQQPVLPEPVPSFPKAAAPRGGKPVPAPSTSGSMAGVIQGAKGVKPGQSDLSS